MDGVDVVVRESQVFAAMLLLVEEEGHHCWRCWVVVVVAADCDDKNSSELLLLNLNDGAAHRRPNEFEPTAISVTSVALPLGGR